METLDYQIDPIYDTATVNMENFNLQTILKKCNFSKTAHLDLAVSGGADSVALLLLVKEAGLTATVWHVNHQLREEAEQDSVFVKELAEANGFHSETRTCVVDGTKNVEAAARKQRKTLMPEKVCTAHTQEDQAETFILNLLRGAGAKGLSGMTNDTTKPLLGLTKHETAQICSYYNIQPRLDYTNYTNTYRRNRIRHEVLPLLNEIAGTDVVQQIVRTAGLLEQDENYLTNRASVLDATDCKSMKTQDEAVKTRAVRTWLKNNTGVFQPQKVDVDKTIEVINGKTVACEVAGHRISRSQQKLKIKKISGSRKTKNV